MIFVRGASVAQPFLTSRLYTVGFEYTMVFLHWFAFLDLKQYKRAYLLRDVVAASVVTFLGVPQGIAYAAIAQLPPAMGLYASTFPTLVGGLFRSSHHVVTGPTNAVSLLVGGGILALQGIDPVTIAVTLAFLTGIFQLMAGIFRLGAVVDYISRPVVLGYITGAALLIGLGQLPVITATQGGHGTLFEKLGMWITQIPQTSLVSVIMAVSSALLIFGLRRVHTAIPGPLIVTVLATVLSLRWDLHAYGLKLVMDLRPIPGGLPAFSLPDLRLVGQLLPLAIACTVLSLVESSAVGRALATHTGQRLEMSTDFVGQGLANLAASVATGYPVSGSPARSGLNYRSGAQTRLSGILSGLFMLLILVALGPLANYMPLAAIAGLIIVIAIDLIDLQKIRSVMQSGLSDRSAFLVTLFGTWLIPLDKAIYLGVGISVVLFLRKARFLVFTALTLDVDHRFLEMESLEQRPLCPSIRILEIEGRLFFGVEGELQHLLDEEINRPQTQVLLLRLKRTQGLDFTIATVFQDAAKRLRQTNRWLVLAGLRKDAQQIFERVGVAQEIGLEHLFSNQSPWFADEDEALQHACALLKSSCSPCPFRHRSLSEKRR